MAIISAAKLSDAMKSERLDAEFFYPDDLTLISKLSSKGGKPLGELCEVLNGRTPEDYFDDGDVPIVRSGDLVVPFIYPECNREFLRARASPKLVALQKHDVLISSIGMGSIGKISIVMDPGNFATVSEVTVLRSKGYPAEILFAYLTTHAGQRQIVRQITGATGQQHLLKSKVESILVPALPPQQVVEAVTVACGRAWSLEIEAARELAKAHQSFSAASGIGGQPGIAP
jgi:type I restriction enzyme S subunit